MLPALQRFEAWLERVEGNLLAALVVLMLGLAVYNVFYRNVLVPIQSSSMEAASTVSEPVDKPPVEPEKETPAAADPSAEGGDETGFGGGFGDDSPEADDDGFGGGFDDEPSAPAELPEPANEDEDEGFGGGFGDEPEAEPEQADAETEDEGFGGGFDDDGDAAEAEGDDDEGFGGGFENTDDFEPIAAPEVKLEANAPPSIGPSEPTAVSELVDSMKLEWIDVLLRQLVLAVGFLGAMLAARRRKHITIDALSKVVPKSWLPYIDASTSLLAAVICGFLAVSGYDLYLISVEFPKELMAWADESTFQLMFPIGFGLLSYHFGMRTLEFSAQIAGVEVEIPHQSEEEE